MFPYKSKIQHVKYNMFGFPENFKSYKIYYMLILKKSIIYKLYKKGSLLLKDHCRIAHAQVKYQDNSTSGRGARASYRTISPEISARGSLF